LVSVRAAAGALLMASAVYAAPPSGSSEPALEAQAVKQVDFKSEKPAAETRKFADWILSSGDHKGLPFAIVDKVAAKAYVFRPDGTLRGAAPVLLGLAKGDDSYPGIGERELSDIPPKMRTTPAGRFVAGLGQNASGKDVLWVDYDTAVSMHRVINSKPAERRPHRLATPTPADNRISFGCINVPIKFFDDVITTTFEGTNGIVYVMPEVHSLRKVFAGYGDAPSAPTAQAETPVSRSVTRVATQGTATRNN
jgi:hypothetical protein